jgi:hypothetical protein
MSLKDGEQYQRYINECLVAVGSSSFHTYTTKEDQRNKGENVEGVEVKYDKKVSSTGNLWIEVSEKTDPSHHHFVPNGIYSKHAKYYFIGNYNIAYFFDVETLRGLHQNKRYTEITNNTGTSRGFLLPVADLKNIPHRKVIWKY